MNTRYLKTVLSWLLVFLITIPTLQATVLTFEFQATVAEVQDTSSLLGNAISPGNTITGVFTVDTSATKGASLSQVGSYDFQTGLGAIAKINGLTFQTDPNSGNFHIEVIHNSKDISGKTSDTFLFRSRSNLALSTGVTLDLINWQIDSGGGQALSSTSLPTSLELSKWTSTYGLTFEGHSATDQAQTFLVRSHVFNIFQVPNGTLP